MASGDYERNPRKWKMYKKGAARFYEKESETRENDRLNRRTIIAIMDKNRVGIYGCQQRYLTMQCSNQVFLPGIPQIFFNKTRNKRFVWNSGLFLGFFTQLRCKREDLGFF